jgi:hypothetical protein
MAWKSAKDALFHPTHSPRRLFPKKTIASPAGTLATPFRILISDRALRVGHSSRAKVVQFWRAAKHCVGIPVNRLQSTQNPSPSAEGCSIGNNLRSAAIPITNHAQASENA